MPRNATYRFEIKGSQILLRSGKSILKRMLVSPAFISLWYKINEHDFDLNEFNMLNQIEKNFMFELAKKLKIDNKHLNIQQSIESDKLIQRLQLVEGSISIGNDNEDLKKEYIEILDQLADRGCIDKWTVANLKRKLQI